MNRYVLIGDPLPPTVAIGPKFKILRSIVVANTVLMVNGFAWRQFTPNDAFHNSPMFRFTVRPTPAAVENHVTSFVYKTSLLASGKV